MKKTIGAIAATFWFAALGIAFADTTTPIALPTEAKFSDDADASPAVRAECNLESGLAKWIKEYADSLNIPNTSIEGDASQMTGRVLSVQITNAFGAGGGAWSGGKSVRVKGELREGDKVISTFTGSRMSGGGPFAGFKGTCSIMGRCVKTLGKDIANWLKNPAPNARLGDG